MAVLIQGIDVIVRNSALDERYPGGIDAYRRDCPNGSFCSDGLIARVGFGSLGRAKAFLRRLQAVDVLCSAEEGDLEVAVVDSSADGGHDAPWLRLGRHHSGFAFAYLEGSDPTALIAVPSGWSLASLRHADTDPEMLFLRSDDRSDLFLDRRNGRVVRVPHGVVPKRSDLLN